MKLLNTPVRVNATPLPENQIIERQRERWLLNNTRVRGPLAPLIADLHWRDLNQRGRA